jgi:hypothetical protein
MLGIPLFGVGVAYNISFISLAWLVKLISGYVILQDIEDMLKKGIVTISIVLWVSSLSG